ncbi:MAG: hypothetical protein ABI528_10980 [bacterium]
MSTLELKNNFHKLIDTVNDKELLKYFYDAFLFSSKKNFLKDLSAEETKDLLDSYKESEDENNLLEHGYVKEKYKKWL